MVTNNEKEMTVEEMLKDMYQDFKKSQEYGTRHRPLLGYNKELEKKEGEIMHHLTVGYLRKSGYKIAVHHNRKKDKNGNI